MIMLAHVLVLILIGFGLLPPYVALLLPWLYIWWIGREQIKVGAEVNVDQLANLLAENWKNAEELAEYMVRYWTALRDARSAPAKQWVCMSLAFVQMGLGLIAIWKDSGIVGTFLLIEGVMLWTLAARVNRPMSMYSDGRIRNSGKPFRENEWAKAAAAIIAYSEMNPHDTKAVSSASIVSNDEQTLIALMRLRRNGIVIRQGREHGYS